MNFYWDIDDRVEFMQRNSKAKYNIIVVSRFLKVYLSFFYVNIT